MSKCNPGKMMLDEVRNIELKKAEESKEAVDQKTSAKKKQ